MKNQVNAAGRTFRPRKSMRILMCIYCVALPGFFIVSLLTSKGVGPSEFILTFVIASCCAAGGFFYCKSRLIVADTYVEHVSLIRKRIYYKDVTAFYRSRLKPTLRSQSQSIVIGGDFESQTVILDLIERNLLKTRNRL